MNEFRGRATFIADDGNDREKQACRYFFLPVMAFLNDITLGQYYPGTSFLHRLDPRSKLFAGLLFMTFLLLSETLPRLALFALVCGAGLLFSGIPGKIILKNLKPFLWLFLITFGIHLFTTGGTEFYTLPGLGIALTHEGLQAGFSYSIRLALLILFAALLTLTTAPMELTDGLDRLLAPLRRFRLPVHEFTLMMTLALRFVPIILREGERIKNAQLSRGATLEGSMLQRVRNIVPMILPLFVSAIRRAEELAAAMEARAYVAGARRTSFRKLAFGKNDLLFMGGLAFFGVAYIFL